MVDKKRAPLETAEGRAREVARMLKGVMPEGWGFALLLASHGDGGLTTYVSSLERKGMVALLRETADKIEKDEATR